MKEFRKVLWNRSRAFLQIRLSELGFIGIMPFEKYYYRVLPEQNTKRIVVEFKKK